MKIMTLPTLFCLRFRSGSDLHVLWRGGEVEQQGITFQPRYEAVAVGGDCHESFPLVQSLNPHGVRFTDRPGCEGLSIRKDWGWLLLLRRADSSSQG